MTTLIKLDLRRPHQSYKTADGETIPGVTTICGVLSKPELIQWAAWEERRGIIEEIGNMAMELFSDRSSVEDIADSVLWALPKNAKGEPAYFCNLKRDRSADVGTITHERIRAWHHGTDVDPEGLDLDLYSQSTHGLRRFVDAWGEKKRRVIHLEYEMVSESQRVGGTTDLVYEEDDKVVLEDMKTTKAGRNWPYRDTLAQVSQYAKMYTEVSGQKVDVVRINRIGKEASDPGQIYELNDYQREWGTKLFEAARLAYEASYKLGK